MRSLVAALSFALAGIVSAETQGRVQPDPAIVCANVKPHELCFGKPTDGIARAEYLSEPFYAVILKAAERCSIAETERLQVQALFPRNKVFANRFYCGEDVEENISYTNVDEKYSFLAVYAGKTMAEASLFMRDVKATARFHGANIRKMRAKLVYP